MKIIDNEGELERNEVQFKHLSGPLKFAVIMMFIIAALFGVGFLIGFMGAMMGV